jgi:hypothetical protein
MTGWRSGIYTMEGLSQRYLNIGKNLIPLCKILFLGGVSDIHIINQRFIGIVMWFYPEGSGQGFFCV